MAKVPVGMAVAALSLVCAAAAWAQSAPQTNAPAPKPADACFFQRDVNSFSSPNDHTVYFRVGASDYYELDLMGTCPNLDWSLGLALRNRSGGATICSPMDAELIVRLSGAVPDYCPVNAIRKLSRPEALALGKDRP